MYVKPGGIGFNKPGISFGAYNLEKLGEKIDKRSYFDVSFSHKNYEWKKNRTDRLSGWNMLDF